MAVQALDLKGKGEGGDKTFRWGSLVAGALVVVILAGILVVMTNRARPAFELMGFKFFTSSTWSPATNVFGALAFIYGTIVSSIIAVLLAVPVSLGIALFMTQVAPHWLRRPIV